MWKDLAKGNLEELLFLLNNIIVRLEELEKVNPIQIIMVADGFDIDISGEIKAFTAKLYGVPEFLLDVDDTSKSARKIIKAFQGWKDQIIEHIKLQEHPDNLPEILYGQQEFGCVYVPTELLKRIHCLGEAVLGFLDMKKEKRGELVERQLLEIMIQSSRWVQYTREKWGIMPGAELTIVSPLIDVRNVKPNEQTNPPF